MKTIFHSVFVIVCAMALQARAEGGGGYDHDNGGDICENRFITVRSDLSSWIIKGGAVGLRLPTQISVEQYVQQMLAKIQTGKVSCIDEKVFVGNAEKTCKNFSDADGTLRIQCNSKRFMETSESDQYVLVHHEYAGLAGFETNNGETSNYEISNQITGFLENQIVKKLVVKPPPPIFAADPFDSASCMGPEMTTEDATKLIPTGETGVELAEFKVYSRERWCENKSGCGEWKKIQNQLNHYDQTRTRKFMLIPDVGLISLFKTLSNGIGVDLSSTPPRGDLAGQGAYLNCSSLGDPQFNCTVGAMPSLDHVGEAKGLVAKNCSRFTYKYGFFADKEFFEMEGIYRNADLLTRDIWVERESVFLSYY